MMISRIYNSEKIIFLSKYSKFWNELGNYDLFLLMSFKASLPSLRVLKTSQVREEIIRIVNVVKEIIVESNL